jgi:hypothetical protein
VVVKGETGVGIEGALEGRLMNPRQEGMSLKIVSESSERLGKSSEGQLVNSPKDATGVFILSSPPQEGGPFPLYVVNHAFCFCWTEIWIVATRKIDYESIGHS